MKVTTKPTKYIGIVGIGLNAARNYLPVLSKPSLDYKVQIPFIIDLKSRENQVRKLLSRFPLAIHEYIFINESLDDQQLNNQIVTKLNRLAKSGGLDGLLILTDPRAHKKYLKWAIKHNINVLTEKPISSPNKIAVSPNAHNKILRDYLELKDDLLKSKSKVYIQCQRRYHPGYTFIFNYLNDFLPHYQVPITFLDIYHADGMWNMPDEFIFRENHPYKHGFGKLMHSGYHFIDLYSTIMKYNWQLRNKIPNKIRIYARSMRPADFIYQINIEDYTKLFQDNKLSDFYKSINDKIYRQYGEIDAYIIIQMLNGNKLISNASINLLQNSFSRRAWTKLPSDTYKGNGRIRHERLNLQISHLLNIQAHSYLSYEKGKNDPNIKGVGAEDHFDVYIFRNSGLIGGKALEKIMFGSSELKTNTSVGVEAISIGREKLILDFIAGKDSSSNYFSHENTNRLLAKIYQCLALEHQGKVPEKTYPFDLIS